MKGLPGARQTGVCVPITLTLALLCAGCAFSTDDSGGQGEPCTEETDCGTDKACNIITGACELQVPAAEEKMLNGPFEIVPGGPKWGGAALIAAWPAFTGKDDSFPAVETVMNHMTTGGASTDTFIITVKGTRDYSSFLETIGFYTIIMFIPLSKVAPGTQSIARGSGFLLHCPFTEIPADGSIDKANPWQSTMPEALNKCWLMMGLGEGTITFNETDTTVDTGLVSGNMSFNLLYYGGSPPQFPTE